MISREYVESIENKGKILINADEVYYLLDKIKELESRIIKENKDEITEKVRQTLINAIEDYDYYDDEIELKIVPTYDGSSIKIESFVWDKNGEYTIDGPTYILIEE